MFERCPFNQQSWWWICLYNRCFYGVTFNYHQKYREYIYICTISLKCKFIVIFFRNSAYNTINTSNKIKYPEFDTPTQTTKSHNCMYCTKLPSLTYKFVNLWKFSLRNSKKRENRLSPEKTFFLFLSLRGCEFVS